MKNLLIFSLIVLSVLSFSFASATVNQVNTVYYGTIDDNGNLVKTTQAVDNFNVIGFVCNNYDCSSVDSSLWSGAVINSGSNNFVNLVYPTILEKAGYGLYFYKDGYIPYEVNATWAGEGTADPRDRYLTKAENCEVPILNLMVSHTGNKVRVNLTLDAKVSSPLQHAGPLNYVPSSISNLYSIDSKVDFRFIGPENVSITKSVNLPFSENRDVFAETTLAAGQYIIEVESNTVDAKCLNSISNLKSESIFIADNRTNATLPLVDLISPESKTYNNKTILVNIYSQNATSVFYSWNGVNVSYTNPVYVTFNEGQNTIIAYAKNNVATAFEKVVFTVDTSNNNTNNSLPSLEIASPEHKGYTNRTILVNLISTGASKVWFSWKGHNYTYTNPVLFTFDLGFNDFTAYASNSIGTVSSNVNFFIDPNLVCYTTLPYLKIESPKAQTYNNQNLLLNITYANATQVWYNINNGLNFSYSSSSDINVNEGSNTVYAYARNPCGISFDLVTFQVNLNNDNPSNPHSGGKKVKAFPPMDEVENETLTPIYLEEDVVPIVVSPKKLASNDDFLTIMLIILGVGIILLIILVIFVSLRK